MMVLSSVTVHPHPLHSESSGEADMSGDSGEKAVGGQQTDSNYLQLAPGKKPKAGKDLESAVLSKHIIINETPWPCRYNYKKQ